MATACDACHPQAIYTGTPSECASCHNDPHTDAFGQDCARCHDTVGFQLAQFDHVDAVDCHSCHSGDAPANHFPGQCSSCHSTATWVGASFAHTFPLDHGEANGKCQTCHPGDNYTAYTCYSCHNEGTIAREHREQGITDLANCVRCHPTGREEDDDED